MAFELTNTYIFICHAYKYHIRKKGHGLLLIIDHAKMKGSPKKPADKLDTGFSRRFSGKTGFKRKITIFGSQNKSKNATVEYATTHDNE
jgi:hypothetical protein